MENSKLHQLLSMASFREAEAASFYSDVAKRVDDPNVKELFEDLARQEKDHEDLIERFRKDPSIADKIKSPPDFKIAENEDLPELNLRMKPVEAVTLAMKKEQRAAEFYDWLAGNSLDDDVKRMCKNLSEMERMHKHRLEKTLVDMSYPEAW